MYLLLLFVQLHCDHVLKHLVPFFDVKHHAKILITAISSDN